MGTDHWPRDLLCCTKVEKPKNTENKGDLVYGCPYWTKLLGVDFVASHFVFPARDHDHADCTMIMT
jgi:hypothetical protein